MRKIWDIHGGVHPPENKSQSNGRPIATIPLASELIIPLNQHIGVPCFPIVAVGDTVKKGQKIADAQGFISTAAHAPTSGQILAIEERAIPHSSGLKALCVVLEPDGKDEWKTRNPIENWQTLSPETLIEIVREAGIAGMGGAGFPTSVKMTPRSDQHIDTLILNGTECEPYITADDMLMRECADEVIRGAEIIAHILKNPSHLLIGVEDNKPEAAEAMRAAAAQSAFNFEVITFPTKYPSGGEKQLIQILTGKEVKSGKLPADEGIVLQNIGTAQAVFHAVCLDQPLISRITTVVGESLEIQRNVLVPIGTPIDHILAEHAFDKDACRRLIIGGPMMGFAMENPAIPVIKTTNCILVPSKNELPDPEPAQPCIRCGMCAEACPASLLPQQLYWYSRSEDYDRLRSHNLFDCIECGACSFVCPSNIPLVQYYRASKGAIRQHDEEKRKSEHSRQRFEFRKERLEKAEAEKAAKRAARKKAADAAKAKLADGAKPAPIAPNAQSAEATVTDGAKASEADTSKTLAKLQRALTSAESRLERAKKALHSATEEGSDSARLETLSARVKDAEQKVADAKTRLESQGNTPQTSEVSKEVKAKIALSPEEKLIKNIETLEKRIDTAKQKAAEAEENQAPTLGALKTGVTKLEEKLKTSKEELERVRTESNSEANKQEKDSGAQQNNASLNTEEENAAEAAIEKAKKRAEALATMSSEEKAKAQLESVQKRLDKARQRLEKAEREGDDNIDAFRAGVEKLETKFNTLTDSSQ